MGKVEFSYSPASFDLKELRTSAFVPFWVVCLFVFLFLFSVYQNEFSGTPAELLQSSHFFPLSLLPLSPQYINTVEFTLEKET